jgi:hypothetical protein
VMSAWSRPARRMGRSGIVLLEIFASRSFFRCDWTVAG